MTPRVTVRRRHPNARAKAGETIIDVTSKGVEPWVRFSPFFPLGNIPIPFSPTTESASVEGVWQGLKVFEFEGIDVGSFTNTSMRGLKRFAGNRRGRILGHQAGIESTTLLAYAEARRAIYLPTYRWVLEGPLASLVEALRVLVERGPLVLLDYETNADVDDLRRPLSHASLLLRYLTSQT